MGHFAFSVVFDLLLLSVPHSGDFLELCVMPKDEDILQLVCVPHTLTFLLYHECNLFRFQNRNDPLAYILSQRAALVLLQD